MGVIWSQSIRESDEPRKKVQLFLLYKKTNDDDDFSALFVNPASFADYVTGDQGIQADRAHVRLGS
jgi:hypothetical protein